MPRFVIRLAISVACYVVEASHIIKAESESVKRSTRAPQMSFLQSGWKKICFVNGLFSCVPGAFGGSCVETGLEHSDFGYFKNPLKPTKSELRSQKIWIEDRISDLTVSESSSDCQRLLPLMQATYNGIGDAYQAIEGTNKRRFVQRILDSFVGDKKAGVPLFPQVNPEKLQHFIDEKCGRGKCARATARNHLVGEIESNPMGVLGGLIDGYNYKQEGSTQGVGTFDGKADPVEEGEEVAKESSIEQEAANLGPEECANVGVEAESREEDAFHLRWKSAERAWEEMEIQRVSLQNSGVLGELSSGHDFREERAKFQKLVTEFEGTPSLRVAEHGILQFLNIQSSLAQSQGGRFALEKATASLLKMEKFVVEHWFAKFRELSRGLLEGGVFRGNREKTLMATDTCATLLENMNLLAYNQFTAKIFTVDERLIENYSADRERAWKLQRAAKGTLEEKTRLSTMLVEMRYWKDELENGVVKKLGRKP